jgi:hypothetical protein
VAQALRLSKRGAFGRPDPALLSILNMSDLKKTAISKLVRKAVREWYVETKPNRAQAMMSVVGLWKDRTDLPDTDTYVRELRRSKRLQRIRA